jgi:hypothetical protein
MADIAIPRVWKGGDPGWDWWTCALPEYDATPGRVRYVGPSGHGEGMPWAPRGTRPPTPEEKREIKERLRAMGYRPVFRSRMPGRRR